MQPVLAVDLVGSPVDPLCRGRSCLVIRLSNGNCGVDSTLLKQSAPTGRRSFVTYRLAIGLQEVIKYFYGANPIPDLCPRSLSRSF